MALVYAAIATLFYGSYVDGIRIQARLVMALARELWNARPRNLRAAERAALEAVLETGQVVDDVLNAQRDVETILEQFRDFGNCWGGMYEALVAKSRLPAGVSSTSAVAARVVEKVFGDGVSFIRQEAAVAWGEGNRRLQRIADLGLERDIVACVGDEYLPAARAATIALGEVIGTGERARARSTKPTQKEAVFAFSRAVSRYARLLAAEVDETDAASIARFRAAVAPIDEYRSTRTTRDEEEEPSEPTPAPTPIPTPGPATPGPFTDGPEGA